MKRTFSLVATFGLALVPCFVPCLGGTAHAQEDLSGDSATYVPTQNVTRVLPTTSSAVVAASPTWTMAAGGYDGAAKTPVFTLGTEVRIARGVSLVAAVAYSSALASDAQLRPQFGARVQFLREAAAGVDGSATVLYRGDRFTSEDGLFQGALAFGRSFGASSAVVNLVYGQDGEGDDHEAEIRVAWLRPMAGNLHLGLEGRYMHAIESTDPNRVALGTPSMEAMAGPLLAYRIGTWAIVGEAGIASRRTTRLETGVAAIAGVGTSF